MENYDRFYKNFIRPPFAPVYHPSSEEFTDPIAYVDKIRHEAQKYGVIKIVPPKDFKPPFCIDREKFTFTPRIQQLKEIEATVREKNTFLERLLTFWNLQGVDVKVCYVDGNFIDLFRLKRAVEECGGHEEITRLKHWTRVARKFNIKSKHGPTALKQHFMNIILPYDRICQVELENEEQEIDEECSGEQETRMRGMAGGAKQKRRRMMAGLTNKKAQSAKKPPKKKTVDPMADVMCMVCQRGDQEEQLLLCEDCDRSSHTHCCDPSLKTVPKGEWRCTKCLARKVNEIGHAFGFTDGERTFNLHTFTEFANDFKNDYFHISDSSFVTTDDVEKEFWQIVSENAEKDISVRYGADLITSKVGSGFPRRGEVFSGPSAKARQQYASHPWNLNNLPVLKDSVLTHIDQDISGMMVPWVYVGMCFSTFCWHTEDHWSYSINYNHWGEPKVWYGLSGENAEVFENTVRGIAPGLTSAQKDLFHHMTTAVNPALLRSKGVDIYTVHQKAGEFVITFPRAYHAGFNEGINFAEAVNFAPIDWLRMGRLCIREYRMVRRYCVFSHDELVMKMVQTSAKLGIAMSLATLDELLEISKRERQWRNTVMKSGVRKAQKENYEVVADDNRTCRKCRTTVFLSAVTCAHGSTVCPEHLNYLCNQCTPQECILKYRYTMDELAPMVYELEERTISYFEWKDEVDEMLANTSDSHKKPSLSEIERVLETARQKRFPQTETMIRLVQIVKECNAALEQTRLLVEGRVKTREKTRNQRADTRMDLAGIEDLVESLNSLPCYVKEHIDMLETFLMRALEWQKVARTYLSRSPLKLDLTKVKPKVEDDDKALIKARADLTSLLAEGEQFEVRMVELDALKRVIDLDDWSRQAAQVLVWEADTVDDSNFLYRNRSNVEDVFKMLMEGGRLFCDDPMARENLDYIHSRYKSALIAINQVEEFLDERKANHVELFQLWEEVKHADWVANEPMNLLRQELVLANKLETESKERTEWTISAISGKIAGYEKSSILRSSEAAHLARVELKRMEEFTEKLVILFQKNNSYHELAQIIGEREELAALAEGQTVTLHHLRLSLSEQWLSIGHFDTVEDMHNHQTTLHDQNTVLFGALRVANSRRSAKETCVCANDKENTAKHTPIVCFLCRAEYHVECCDWDPLLGRLPDGAFLCVRCLRSKRPMIDDVAATCNNQSNHFLEVALVRRLVTKSRQCSREIMRYISQVNGSPRNEAFTRQLWVALSDFLSCEIMDGDIFRRVTAALPKIDPQYFTHEQISAWHELSQRPARVEPAEILFAPARKGKRSSTHAGRRERKRTRPIYHEDDDSCAAHWCLKPISEQVGWIQCEAGCSRWFHYVCVGQTAEQAEKLAQYSCDLCETKNSQ